MYDITQTPLAGVLVLELKPISNEKNHSFQTFSQESFNKAIKSSEYKFVQDNQSKSIKNVLRGMHYQIKYPQGKLIRVLNGSIYDVVIDLRKKSESFGEWYGLEISSSNAKQIWIPPGFAHGFLVTSDTAEILYKTTEYWEPKFERTLIWSDPNININWPLCEIPILSERDSNGTLFGNTELFE